MGVRRWSSAVGKRMAVALCGAIAAVGIGAIATPAAENLEIRYGPIGVDIDIDDLEAFAEGEETSPNFRNLVRQIEAYGGVTPETLRTAVSFELDLETLGLNRIRAVDLLYSFLGKRILRLGSEVMYPPLNRGNVYALRGAIALSLLDDGKISVLEVLKRYKPDYVRLDAARLLSVADDLQEAFSGLGGLGD
ncbi:MAG: alpha/beta hydrolase [Cyanobacteria bacterium P01_H01_bin.130]